MTIEEALSAIKNAVYGKDVRQAMHDGILQAEGGAGTVAKKAEASAKDSAESAKKAAEYSKKSEIASKAIEGKADQAVTIAKSAKNKSDSTQFQLDEIVINGDSSVEAAQARVDIKNITHATLKDRLDKEQQEVTAQLAQTNTDIEAINKGRGKTKIPLVTFTSDDGAIQDYTRLKPIFEAKGVPCTLGIVSDWVGQPGRMSIAQIKELEDLGWEMASHTKTHAALANLTKNQVEVEAKQSKEELESMGLKIDNLIYPYGSQNLQVREVANKYYDCSVRAGLGQSAEPAIEGQINTGVLKTHMLNRIPLGSFTYTGGNTLDYYKSKVDLAVENNAWLIFMMHSWHEDHDEIQQSILSSLIDYIKSLSVPIVNMREGHDLVGNILDIGDVEKEHRVAISSVGEVEKNDEEIYVEIPYQGITLETKPDFFPNGKISIAHFPYGNDSGFPGKGSAGMLETYRIKDNMVRQEFTTWVGGYKLHRTYDVTRPENVYQWTEFKNEESLYVEIPYQGITTETPPDFFPLGKISIANFPYGNKSGFPGKGSAGLLETYRLKNNMVSQEFTTWVGGYKLHRTYDVKRPENVYKWTEFKGDSVTETPELLNGWVGVDWWGGLKYTKTGNGTVYINGGVKSGVGDVVFNLPVGYRPERNIFYFIGTDEGPVEGQIRAKDGAVLIPPFAKGGEFKISVQFPVKPKEEY